MKLFDAEQVRAGMPMAVCIDLMEEVQASISRGDIRLPRRSFLPLPDTGDAAGNSLLIMPGALPGAGVFGAKLLSLYPENGHLHPPLPAIQGYLLLFDGGNGSPLALIDAGSLTAIRTAAASAAATRALAGPDAADLALLGYGVQAATHLEAMQLVRPIRNVRVWGPSRERAADFAAEHSAEGLPVDVAETPEEAVRGADLICAVSAATSPVIKAGWLRPGCHLNLVGAHSPDAREADSAAIRAARLFTEITEFALQESGDILLAMAEGAITREHIAGEIGEVFDGRLAGRESADQITIYKSLGNTAQDLRAGQYLCLENR